MSIPPAIDEEEFRALLLRQLEHPETRRKIMELVVAELRRVAREQRGGTAPLHHVLNDLA